MEHFKIIAKKREDLGKKAAKNLRKEDFIPCVVYGGEENLNLYVETIPFEKATFTPKVYLMDLDVDGTIIPAVIQDVQYHPVTDKAIHIDFYQITDDKPVSIYLPIRLVGLSVGVKAGGRLKQNLRYLRVQAFHEDLPDFVEVDITKLKIGQGIKVRDLSFDKLTLLDPMNNVVVAVKTARGTLAEEEAEAEAAEAAEAADESNE
ncbi:MAG: 50S ribosomal protein L25/general stress protein Ctc [Bacteroidales bacterium]|nr:50S ribosomal protein L25/general stress protein Ctc [Bacteroidales bacterium]